MAKRRKLEAPSSADLARIEEQFRGETSGRGAMGMAPIAQVAAETAAQTQTESSDARAARVRVEADAARLHAAQEQGLLISEIPVDQIDEAAMVRDRMVMSEEDLQELRVSIAAHGLRLPIELFELEKPGREGQRYGLLSGYRRLQAVRGLLELTEADKYRSIRALVRPRADADAAFVAMVEENEVRAELSHFERGRIAVISANQGAFADTEDAVNKLFAAGSKAKRSKIRSFALIFEELGDMLLFPEALTEKRGLRLSAALRRGGEAALRKALSEHVLEESEAEWVAIEEVLTQLETGPKDPARGGRPKTKPASLWSDSETIEAGNGITIQHVRDKKAHVLRFEGRALTDEIMEQLLDEIQATLSR